MSTAEETFDALNKIFADIEVEFRKNITARGSVVIRTDADGHRYNLAFGKVANEWRLIVEKHDGPGVLLSQSPLANVSIELRMQAANKLDELYAACLESSDEQLRHAREAIAKTHAFLKKMVSR